MRRKTRCPGGDEEKDKMSKRRCGERHDVQEEMRRKTRCPGGDEERDIVSIRR